MKRHGTTFARTSRHALLAVTSASMLLLFAAILHGQHVPTLPTLPLMPSSRPSSVRPGAPRHLRLRKRLCAARGGGEGGQGEGEEAGGFIVLFMGHSGSTAILSELAAHSRILANTSEVVDFGPLTTDTDGALALARRLLVEARALGKMPGFKMRPRHVRAAPARWRALAREFGLRVVWNFRGNVFKQAVGEYALQKRGDRAVVEGLQTEAAAAARTRCRNANGTTNGGGGGDGKCRFRVDDADFFHQMLLNMVRVDSDITAAVHLLTHGTQTERALCVHELPYEDYLYDRAATMRALFDFLGVRHERTRPRRFKATSDNLCDAIENWQELCPRFYACHAWRALMDDEVNGCSCDGVSDDRKYCATTEG